MDTVQKYKKSTIYHDICIKVFFDRLVSYITVFADDFINTNNNEIGFYELKRIFEDTFEMKVRENLSLST